MLPSKSRILRRYKVSFPELYNSDLFYRHFRGSRPISNNESDNTAHDLEFAPSRSAISPGLQEQLQNNYSGDASEGDWSRSYFGLSTEPFSKEIAGILQSPVDSMDIEIKPGF